MKELSLNILDIAENSVKAGASLIEINLEETEQKLIISIKDNGCGMSKEVLKSVTDPFYTTRTTRKVGLGIPFFKMEAEQTGGKFEITSKESNSSDDLHGTAVCAEFLKTSIDFIPLGNISESLVTLIQGHPDRDFLFKHSKADKTVTLDTRELRKILDDIPLDSYEVIKFIKEYLLEQYSDF